MKEIFLIFSVCYAKSCPGRSKDGSESGLEGFFSGIWDLTNIQCRLLENPWCLKARWDFTAAQEAGFAKI